MGRRVGGGAWAQSLCLSGPLPPPDWPVGSSPGALVTGEELEEATVGRSEVGPLPLNVHSVEGGHQGPTPRPSQGAPVPGTFLG